ncbi:MAG: hypothetical protein RLZZ366_2067 [Pseudomonadota bacterium]|jgi:zinc protease
MILRIPRVLRSALILFTSLGLIAPAFGQTTKAALVNAPNAAKPLPWLYKGSDIPPDPNWTFGVLPNGLRYAVRRSGVPPHQVSIRVDIEAGALNEQPTELGYAHFMEHLSFRGSRFVADGEAKRVWQRLGATFGSDTNASTTYTQTIYKLDLPSATRDGLDESVKILSGMMAAPSMSTNEVDTERRTVLAEARESNGPQVKVGDASRKLFFAGQLIGVRSPIGTTETLNAATAATMRAFHDRWYRPERAVVVISGDADPAIFEALVVKYFSDWKGIGATPADPDFGKPLVGTPASAVVTEPGLPLILSMATLRPWFQKNDTIAYNQGKLIDLVAIRLINRRLEQRARAGGSFLQADVNQDDVSRSVDGTFIQVVPVGSNWKAALNDVRSVIADALVNPSAQSEIDREAGEFISSLQVGVETQRTEAAAKQADDLIEAVNIRETVATAQVALDVFGGIKEKITPAAILESTKRLFNGVGPRAILTSPTALPGAAAELASAIVAPVKALTSQSTAAVKFDQLPMPGAPGTVAHRTPIPGLDMEIVEFANGVKLMLFANPAESGKIYVSARFGNGMKAIPKDRTTPIWAASTALIAGGVGPFDQNDLDRLTSGRKIGLGFSVADDAFVLSGQTRSADLRDQLRLMVAQLTAPRWDPAPINRARASFLTGYDTIESAPQAVLSRDLGGLLHGGDKRWTTPSRADIAGLTPAAFKNFLAPLLKTGPIELSIFGDVTADEAIAAAAASFGAMPPRTASPILPNLAGSRGPMPTPTPIVRTHKGQKDQAVAVLSWPLGGGMDGVQEDRKLEILSQIFNDRMFDQLREAEGASYSPNVSSNWPLGLNSGGNFTVTSQIKPENIDRFFALSRKIATDFASTPVSADELTRVIAPLRELIARASSGNTFWMSQLAGATRDPRKISALKTMTSDYERITPADIQAVAKKWLVPSKEFRMVVKPQSN